MNKNTFCPFIKGECRKDCVFHNGADVAVNYGIVISCTLAIQSHNSNEIQQDQLSEIINLLEK